MCVSINSIIKEHDDLHFITISKPSKVRSTWTFEVKDPTSRLNNTCDKLSNYNYKIITLQRGEHFFVAYKFIFEDGSCEYMVDPKKSIHRSSPKKYIDNLMNYVVWSNDISYLKNDPSFKYTQMQMFKDNISNYLDLCVFFKDYSSIGTGLTRDIRNIIVMDIDVNCENPENKSELDRLIILFSQYDFTPDFYIINHESKHVQLQWLIKNCQYKNILWEHVNKKIKYLETTSSIYKELSLHDFNFMELSQDGLKYRKFTKALTKLSSKYKFGDPNYTFWKAKNLYTAFLGKYNLELKMPKVVDGEITYLTHEQMSDIFNSKESRRRYFEHVPEMEEIYEKTNPLMFKYMSSISEATLKKIKDDLDDLNEPFELYDYRSTNNYDISRNTFVLETTRNITWNEMRELNFKNKMDFLNMSQRNQKSFKSKVKKIVKSYFDDEDKKYKGDWPGTTNHSKYTITEFNSTFGSSFDFAVEHFSNNSYDDDARTKSLEERVLKKQLRHVLIIYLKSILKCKKKELLRHVNEILIESKHVPISNTTFKRDLKEIDNYNLDEKKELITHVLSCVGERKEKYFETCMETDDKKEINTMKKRMNRLWMINMDDIVKYGEEHM